MQLSSLFGILIGIMLAVGIASGIQSCQQVNSFEHGVEVLHGGVEQ